MDNNMAPYNFKKAMVPLLKFEGGKVNDPDDPGGRTNKGVTQAVYDGYRRRVKNLPVRSVYNMTDVEMMDIYKEQYWDPIMGDDLPDGIDYCIYDAAVNSGTTQAAKWAQRACGHTPVDGHIGMATMNRLNMIDKNDTESGFIDNFSRQRLSFMRSLRTWSKFGNGWQRRVSQVSKISKAWVDGAPKAQMASLINECSFIPGKACAGDTKITETPMGAEATKQVTAGGTGVMALILGYFQDASDWISGFTGLSPDIVKYVLGGLAFMAVSTVMFFAIQTLFLVVKRRAAGERQEANSI